MPHADALIELGAAWILIGQVKISPLYLPHISPTSPQGGRGAAQARVRSCGQCAKDVDPVRNGRHGASRRGRRPRRRHRPGDRSWASLTRHELGIAARRRAALAPAQLSGDKHPTHLIIIDKLLYQTSEPRELPKRHDGAAYEPLFLFVGTMILVCNPGE